MSELRSSQANQLAQYGSGSQAGVAGLARLDGLSPNQESG